MNFHQIKKKLIENSEYYNNIMKHPWFNNYTINDIIGNNNHCYIDKEAFFDEASQTLNIIMEYG